MKYGELVALIGKFGAGRLKIKAAQAARALRLGSDEIEDLEQDLLLWIIERKPHFNPKKGKWNTWVKILIERRLSLIFNERNARKRLGGGKKKPGQNETERPRGELFSIEEISEDSLSQTIWATGDFQEEDLLLRIDFERFYRTLSPRKKEILCRLQVDRGKQVAQDLGICRGTLYDHLKSMRKSMRSLAMEKYLKT